MRPWFAGIPLVALAAVGAQGQARAVDGGGQAGSASADSVILSIVGTSDLHGRIAALPWLAGYVDNLRKRRAPGAVLLLDAGDMFQGTLESNLVEGASVVRAYNAMGYTAAALGNHEFDYGPVGPAPAPVAPGDDPWGALKARAAEARFPFLAANIVDRHTHRPISWPNVLPQVVVDAAGIKVGIVGVVTLSTPRTALPANVAGLDFLPLAQTIAGAAKRLRAQGATVVIALAHEGGACAQLDDHDKLDSCDMRSPIFAVARALPRGSVDAIVAGHLHQGLAQRVAGVPVIESFANGRYFGRVDLTVARKTGRVMASDLAAPREICPGSTTEHCTPTDYEGAQVTASEPIQTLNARAFAEAERLGSEPLGVRVAHAFVPGRGRESALGNLLADLMRQAHKGSDVALLNGGSLRAGLRPGALVYRSLYETFPFDNAFATVRLPAGTLRRLLTRSFARSGSLVALSGLRVRARCRGKDLDVALSRMDGTPVPDGVRLTLVTSDFLATGGDGFFAGADIRFDLGPSIRDTWTKQLRAHGGTLDPEDPALFDPAHPRFDLPGGRGNEVPIVCPR
jgi:2',3'-cyclic-nucleotide 2'-phosphodiesterase (5'-nucleotidase family)